MFQSEAFLFSQLLVQPSFQFFAQLLAQQFPSFPQLFPLSFHKFEVEEP